MNNAQRVEQEFVKARGTDKLTPTEEVREFAQVAADNGFVSGIGRGTDGKRQEVSTDNSPRIVTVDDIESSSLLAKIKIFVNFF